MDIKSIVQKITPYFNTLSERARTLLDLPKNVDFSSISKKYSSYQDDSRADTYKKAQQTIDIRKLSESLPKINLANIESAFRNWTQTAINRVGGDIIKTSQALQKAPLIGKIGYEIPKKYGTLVGQQIGRGIQQTSAALTGTSGFEGTIPFTNRKVSPAIAGPANIGLGLLGLTPVGVAASYASDIAESGAEKVFGEDTLPAMGVGLAAGFLVPGGESQDAKRLMNFSKEGQKILNGLKKEKRLAHLLSYQDELQKIGYKANDLNLISAQQAAYILEKGISPLEFRGIVPKGNIANKMQVAYSDAKQAYRDWVNTRAASKLEGLQKSKQFNKLDDMGMNGIFEFQAGNQKGFFTTIKNYFDDRYAEVVASGIDMNYRRNYLPQLWQNSQDEIDAVFKKTLTKRPSFSIEAVIDDYKKGIQLGLTPKFEKLSDLVAWYEQSTSKAMADRNFLNYLQKSKLILPESKAPRSWTALAEGFPKFKMKIDNETYSGSFKAEPELAKLINNYFADPTGPHAWFAKLATRVKNIGLAGGIPGTSLNFHGIVNVFRRDLIAANNPARVFFRDIKWMVNPNTAAKYVEQNLDDAVFFQKHGLTLQAEDWNKFNQEVPKNVVQKIENFWDHIMGDPLFKKTLPAIKVDFAKRQYKQLLKDLPEDEAARVASEVTNSLFGGINLDELARSKETQNFLRELFLAPDWMETSIKTGLGVLKGLAKPTDPRYAAYRTVARNMTFFYVLENIANKIMSGHWMYENDQGKQFYLDTGTYTKEGKKRYFADWGTAQDYVRVPAQVAFNIIGGQNVAEAVLDPIKNRFSMPLSAGLHLGMNQDYRGRPIYGEDQYGKPIPRGQQAMNVFNELASGVGLPPQLRAGVNVASGRIGTEEGIVSSLEAPIRYSSQLYTKEDHEKYGLLTSAGHTPEQAVERIKSQREVDEKEGILDRIFSWFKSEETTAAPERTDLLLKYMDEQAQKSEEAAKIKTILETAATREEAEKMLANEGLPDFETATVSFIKDMGVENGVRPGYLMETLKGLDDQEFGKQLKFFMEKSLVTTGVIEYWQDMGHITDEQAKKFKELIKVTKGQKVTEKKKTFKKIPISKIAKVTPAKIKVKRVMPPTFKPLKPVKINVPKFAI